MKHILMLFTLLAGLTMQAQVPSYVPTDGLVGYWPFDGNANDESGNGNDGTVNGATLTEDRFGNPNSAYLFTVSGAGGWGSAQNRIVVSNPTIPSNNSFTMSAWVEIASKPAPFSDRPHTIMGRWDGNGTRVFRNFITYSGEISTNLFNGVSNAFESGGVEYGSWELVVITYDGSTLRQYQNNVLTGSIEFNIELNSSTTDLTFGELHMANGHWYLFSGKMDEAGYWNRALTEEEVLALYNANDCSVSIETIAGDLTPFTLEENTYNCTNTPNSTYEWEVEGGVITSGQGTSTVTVLWAEEGAGSLAVTETTEDGCDGTVSIEVEIVCSISATAIEGPLGPGELLEVTYTCDGDASSTYNWSISNGVITSGQGTNSVTVIWASTGLGSISVQETTSAECDGEEITLDVVVVLGTGIDETLAETINIFPNPASTSVTITIDESLINSDYQLLDAQGKLVSEGVLSKTNTTLNTTGFASGNYVISISNDQGVVRQQIIIER